MKPIAFCLSIPKEFLFVVHDFIHALEAFPVSDEEVITNLKHCFHQQHRTYLGLAEAPSVFFIFNQN